MRVLDHHMKWRDLLAPQAMSTLLAELRFAKPILTPKEHTENRCRRQEEDGNQVNRQQLGEVVPRRPDSQWFQIVGGGSNTACTRGS